MAVHTGRAFESDFITKLVNHLTSIPVGSTEAFWKKVNSGSFSSEGIILESKGTSGNDKIFVQFKSGSNNYIYVRVLHGYVPNAIAGLDGSFISSIGDQQVQWWSTTYSAATPFDYWLSFDRDRIMLFASADKTVYSTPAYGTLLWVGMTQRLSPETDSTAVAMAASRMAHPSTGDTYANGVYGQRSKCKMIQGRSKVFGVVMNMITSHPFRSVGWGGRMYLPSVFLDSGSGVRAIMHGIHPLVQPPGADEDFEHGDEITVGSKRYTIFKVSYAVNYDQNSFSSDWIAVEHLK